jgi:hypothetical protein
MTQLIIQIPDDLARGLEGIAAAQRKTVEEMALDRLQSLKAATAGESIFRPEPHVDVLRRVFDLSRHGVSAALAESILELDFPEEDAVRVDELNARANEGTLTGDEHAELEAYINIGDLLAYWQSKARRTLQ